MTLAFEISKPTHFLQAGHTSDPSQTVWPTGNWTFKYMSPGGCSHLNHHTYIWVFLPACLFVHHVCNAQTGQKKASDSLRPELQMSVSWKVGLGNWTQVFWKKTSAPNHLIISPVPITLFVWMCAYLSVCTWHVCRCPGRPEEGIRSPRIRINRWLWVTFYGCWV